MFLAIAVLRVGLATCVSAVAVGAFGAACLVPEKALAASWANPLEQGGVPPTSLSGLEAVGPIQDRVILSPTARASASAPSRVEAYTDAAGNEIVLGTSIDGLDLAYFASVLAGVVHGSEISELRTRVVAPEEVAQFCGTEGTAGVVACYYADDASRLFSGEIVIPSAHPQLEHAIVHEYGHHMDNQLLNLGHLSQFCDFGQDGSRRWFFVRDAYDDLSSLSGCTQEVAYERLLGELYAEDFVAYNGIDEWQLSAFPPPGARALSALGSDIARPFAPRRERYSGWLMRGRYQSRLLRFKMPIFLTIRLRGPVGADFDLRLRAPGRRRPIAMSVRRGSRERVSILVGAGRYRLDVIGYAGRGRYRVIADIE